ncbi:protein draper [Bicyclus anynana]|uniref:Protein draper n=1 Tax=Bicyclus anynana TaxID=110368 RepID=A0A6J1P2L6_BICAN|nr:protein draper [Bicyclus anynana]
MKWLFVVGYVVCLAVLSKSNALSCQPGSEQDAQCISENTEKVPETTQPSSNVREREKDRWAECLAGSEWDSNCHKCRCSEEGHAECTRMDVCEKGDYGDPIRCKPKTTFKKECNTCSCLETGHSVCTLIGCLSALPSLPDVSPPATPETDATTLPPTDKSKDCLVGSRWKSKCNECFCSEDGYPSCTEMACIGLEDEPEKMCAPETSWKVDCNTCWCYDGRPVCTRIGCNGHIITNFNPKRENSKNDEPQIVLRSATNEKDVVCAANRMFIKDCNTCWCNEDGTSYFCTRKVCITDLPEEVIEDKPENLQEIKRKCRPDEVFEIDCNMCRCNPDGMSFSCTRRACVPEEKGKNISLNRRVRATAQETPKTCQPGTEFRMDCNKCLCNDEGQDFSCTRIDCAAQNGNGNGGARRKRATTQVQTQCVPDSVFNQDCNACRCEADGNHATCSIKRCKQDNPNEDEENEVSSESDLSFRCNPGEQFKRGCNDCSCSADGKSVFCTVRLCD